MHNHEGDQKLLDDINEFGLSVIHIPEDDCGPAYSFSIGLYHTYKHPEVIILGLSQDGMHTIINNLAFDIKAGARYEAESLYDDILLNHKCTFREVTEGWFPHYLGYGCWYYHGSGFPALQCIWPDKSQNFPWEDGFNKAWLPRQPLLFGNVGRDPTVNLKSDWPFRDPKNTASCTCKHVMNEGKAILSVGHDYSDGTWVFLDDSDHSREELVLVGISEVASKHPDILQLADLPAGWQATRDGAGKPWERNMQGNNLDD